MNRLSVSERARIIAALVEGNSLRPTSRLCGVAFNTVLNLLPEIGMACAEYHDAKEAGLSDHVWSMEELAAIVPTPEAQKRGPYKKKAA